MISFKLSPETHASVSRVLKVITWVCYIAGMIFVALTGVNNYLTASKIMSNHNVVDAALSFEGTTVQHKKRRDVVTYHFKYKFAVDGTEYEKEFTTSESNADKFLNDDTVQVGYSVENPSLHERMSKLKADSDLMSWLKRFLISIPLFGVVAFVVYLMLTRRLFVVRPEAA